MTNISLGGWLVHVMREADGALSLEEALHVIMDSTKDYFPSQSVAVILIDDDTKELRIKISRQISYSFVKKFHVDGPSATAERVVLEQQPILLNDIDTASETYKELKLEHEFTSAVLAPIIKNQRGIGYIFCDRTNHEQFTETDLLHLQVLGYIVGNLIEKFELIKTGKTLSQIDDATKALQYKAFVPAFATELERAKTHSYEIVLALISVNAFRKHIETYGIDAAHSLLADVVAVIKKHTRDMDLIARFGADEFILCLSGLTPDEGLKKLADIKNAVHNTAIGRGDTPVGIIIGALGIGNKEASKQSLQDILAALGKSLVAAKGKNADSILITNLT